MSETNATINIETVVDASQVEELQSILEELIGTEFKIDVDSSGLDDIVDSAEQASDSMDNTTNSADDLNNSTNNIDSGGLDDVASAADNIASSIQEAADSVSELDSVLGAVAGTVGLASLDGMANSAASAEISVTGLNAALGATEGSSTADAAADSIERIAKVTPLSKGEVRSMWQAFAVGGIKSVDTLDNLTSAITAWSVKSGKDINTVASSLNKAFISDAPNRAFKTLGVDIKDVARELGMTEESFKSMWKAATPEERADLFSDYINQTTDVQGLNKDLADSYITLRENVENSLAKIATAIGKILLPVLEPAVAAIADILSFVGDVINALPGPVKGAIGFILTFAGVLGFLGGMAPLVSKVFLTFKSGFDILNVGIGFFKGIGAAAGLSLGPVLLIIGAVLAIGFAIFEVGKALGWWEDLPSMFAAIGDGVKRLWDAFVNNEHVKAAIQWLQEAWQFIQANVLPIVDSFFSTVADGFVAIFGTSDVVSVLISLFGALGDILAFVFEVVSMSIQGWILFFQAIWQVVQAVITFAQWLWNLPAAIATFVTETITWISQLPGYIWAYLSNIISNVAAWASNIVSKARTAASQFVNGVLTFIRTLPSRLGTILTAVIARVISWAARLVSTGRSAATRFVSGVVAQARQLPGRVYSAIVGVVARVSAVFSNLYNKVMGWWNKLKSLNWNFGANASFNSGFVDSVGIEYSNVVSSPFDNTPNSQFNNTNTTDNTTFHLNFNGLITERDAANYIIDVVESHYDREATRS